MSNEFFLLALMILLSYVLVKSEENLSKKHLFNEKIYKLPFSVSHNSCVFLFVMNLEKCLLH